MVSDAREPAPRVLVIADDLTGAMDAAGPFASRGLATWVAALPEDCDPARFARAEVVSVNTESRHLAPAQAAARVQEAFRRVGGDAFPVVVKKVDSTLRGNVLAEIEALMSAARRDQLVACPAFPSQGRVLQDGRLRVRGIPLEDTEFARDALSPALVQPLAQALEGAGIHPVRAMTPAQLPAEGFAAPGAWVVDAATDDDLRAIGQVGLARGARVLLAGSAGLTAAVASLCAPEGGVAEAPEIQGRIVYVVGSRSRSSRSQVDALLAGGATLVEAVNGRLRKEPVLVPGADVVLLAVPDRHGREGDAAQVAGMLARHAIRLAGPGNAQAVVATGGDTATAFLRTSGNAALPVGGELMPGIAYTRFMMGTRPVWLVTKAGGFGDDQALLDIGRRLRASPEAGLSR